MLEITPNPVDAGQNAVVEHTETVATESAPSEVKVDAMQTPAVDENHQSADDNAKFASARREAEAKAKAIEDRLKRVEAIATKAGSNSIEDFADMLENQLKENEEQRRREALEEVGLDPYTYDEMVKNDPTVASAREVLAQQKKEIEWRNQQNQFLDYFSSSMGRPFDGTRDTVSNETMEMVNAGIPLLTAYKANDEVKVLKQQLDDLRLKIEADETNKRNSETSTGGVGTQATSTEVGFIDVNTFETNKSDKNWVKNNLDAILKSRPKWR